MTEISETLRILDGLAAAHRFGVQWKIPIRRDHSSWSYGSRRDQTAQKHYCRNSPARFPNVDAFYEQTYDGTPDVKITICEAPRTGAIHVRVDGRWGVCCHSSIPECPRKYELLEMLPFQGGLAIAASTAFSGELLEAIASFLRWSSRNLTRRISLMRRRISIDQPGSARRFLIISYLLATARYKHESPRESDRASRGVQRRQILQERHPGVNR